MPETTVNRLDPQANGSKIQVATPDAPTKPVEKFKFPLVGTGQRFADSRIKLMKAHCNSILWPGPNALVCPDKGLVLDWVVMPSQVTPELLSDKNNSRNRDLTPASLARLMESFRKYGFVPTTDCIGIFENGLLANGQYRLMAMAKTNTDATVAVLWNIPLSTAKVMDMGKARSVAEAVKIVFPKMRWVSNGVAGTANRMHLGTYVGGGGDKNSKGTQRSSRMSDPDEMHAFLKAHSRVIQQVYGIFSGHKAGITSAGPLSAMCVAAYHLPPKQLEKFANILYTGDDHGCTHEGVKAVTSLRRFIFRVRGEDKYKAGRAAGTAGMYILTQRVIQAFIDQQSLTVNLRFALNLIDKREEVYSLPA